jgi:hypothetical protein
MCQKTNGFVEIIVGTTGGVPLDWQAHSPHAKRDTLNQQDFSLLDFYFYYCFS